MKSGDAMDYRRAGVSLKPPGGRFVNVGNRLRACVRPLVLILISIVAFSLAFAPVSQFYLAWIGLVPFLVMVHERQSQRAAFLWGWLAGILFFLGNMWWLVFVTAPGTAALGLFLGLYFAVAALLFRGCGLLEPEKGPGATALSIVLLATVWTALEWLRGTYSPFGHHGLPWLYTGYTQTPFLAWCQIADFAGVYGVTFCVMLINALVARLWIDRARLATLRLASAVVAGILMTVTMYGIYRLFETKPARGPTVLVVQPNYPQSNTGEKGAALDEIVRFHVSKTEQALKKCQADGVKVDLVVWSETMMPPLNKATRDFMRGSDYGQFIQNTSQQISDLADQYRTGILVGGSFSDQWKWISQAEGNAYPAPADHRNSAYFYEPTGLMSEMRYDKIQLLPFGEYVPYKEEIPPLYRLLMSLGPPDMKYYELTAGAPDALIVFPLETFARSDNASSQPVTAAGRYRFVTPICFEDIVAPLVRDLFNGGDGTKRADFIVNLTNDGWFKASEHAQHLQASVFRCIENRVSTARSVNTGVSGFIDPVGRVSDCVPANTEGWAVHQLTLDQRATVYTRVGDVFAGVCGIVTAAVAGLTLTLTILDRRRRTTSLSD